MRLAKSLLAAGLLALSATKTLAATWTFTEGSVSVQSKGTGVGGARKETYEDNTSQGILVC